VRNSGGRKRESSAIVEDNAIVTPVQTSTIIVVGKPYKESLDEHKKGR
jgi:hypothetical protein